MDETKYAPGPWTFGGPVKCESIVKRLTGDKKPNGLSRQVYEIGQAGDRFPPGICVVNDYRSMDGEFHSAEDNARLIAAAPDLLEACTSAFSFINIFPLDDVGLAVSRQLEEAIEKAEGTTSSTEVEPTTT